MPSPAQAHFKPDSDVARQVVGEIESGIVRPSRVDCAKTQKCRFFHRGHGCRNGPRCKFAHDDLELRVHPRHAAVVCGSAMKQLMPLLNDPAALDPSEKHFLAIPINRDRNCFSTVSTAASESAFGTRSSGSMSPPLFPHEVSVESVGAPDEVWVHEIENEDWLEDDAALPPPSSPHLLQHDVSADLVGRPANAWVHLMDNEDWLESAVRTVPLPLTDIRHFPPAHTLHGVPSPQRIAQAAPLADPGQGARATIGRSVRDFYRSRGDQMLLDIREGKCARSYAARARAPWLDLTPEQTLERMLLEARPETYWD